MAYEYTPSKFMLPSSHYDKAKADRAVIFIQNLCHTKTNGAMSIMATGMHGTSVYGRKSFSVRSVKFFLFLNKP